MIEFLGKINITNLTYVCNAANQFGWQVLENAISYCIPKYIKHKRNCARQRLYFLAPLDTELRFLVCFKTE